MRYSVLVYLVDMSRTLIEAAEYLATSPAAEMQAEIYENGDMMLTQMREALLAHEQSMKSNRPLKQIDEIVELWKERRGTGQALVDALTAFAQALPGEVDYKVRAVFVAELGEKWDSMASVYACMRDDPRFDPIVVMEPVFRRVKWGEEVKQDIIYKDYLTKMGIPWLGYNKYSMEEDCLPQTYGLFLDGAIIGMYQFVHEDLFVRPDLYPWLANVYLDPAYRNRGYGTVLMEHIRNTAREGLPFQELFLYTTHTELYERYGWDFVSEIDTFLEHNRMQRLYRLDLRRNEMV